MNMRLTLVGLALLALLCASGAVAQDIPRPEHPRPQMVRAEWLNLNGSWDFAETDNNEQSFLDKADWPDKIVVPFCRESELSGLNRKGFIKNVWYRRTFQVPADWKSPRVRLHIGACDWRTQVWVNGSLVGQHTGGSAPFCFDVTSALVDGDNTVIVHAFDDTQSGKQPCGKQSRQEKSHGCVYTRTTGIWQTVWLEGVGSSFVPSYVVTPDVANSRILLRVAVDGSSQGLTVTAKALANGKEVAKAANAANWRNAQLTLDLAEKRLWTVEDPFLYDLEITLSQGGEVVDTLNGYFGLRDITIQSAAVLLNGQAVYQRLVLDQGFYPDGIWTAPTEEALKHDIELSQAVGFNGARLHQKVFEPRFLYWADKLGYLVWDEFPNWGADVGSGDVDLPILEEWLEIVDRDINHPSIVGWCPFNETPKQACPIQNAVVAATRRADPTRPVLDTSGWSHGLADPEVYDAHDYDQNPQSLKARWEENLTGLPLPARYAKGAPMAPVPFFVSEYGGIGWGVKEGGWGYGNDPTELEEFYTRYAGLTDALLDNRRMFAFCYTQLYDIEQEQNGIYTYDRKPKFDAARLKAINSRKAAFEIDPPVEKIESASLEWRVLVGAYPDGDLAQPWQYTTDAPPAEWNTPGFDASGWKTGKAGFGKKGGWEGRTATPWDTPDIWLRQTFSFDAAAFEKASLITHYDNGTEVFVNGKKIWSGEGWNNDYAGFEVTEALRGALKQGENVIAVHCHQDTGGQFIDMALIVTK